MNYFELFNIPVTPKVDQSKLSKKYFDLQRKNHPDFFSDATDAEKELNIQLSADINIAYTTFKDDQKTLEYFLMLNGIIEHDEKYKLPDEFLMEMMDFNEELLEISKETAIKKIKEYEMLLFNEVKDSIENCEQQASEEALLKMKEYYYKKKYLNRILDRLVD
jgi:molecular chaperone HscB